ncbi:glycosyltransferase [Acinetobacter radioresistens]|uniref:glycosyltransferase n=1 Tax=Acinetobacter radioresistens TaxID=40216 RepID=UPI002245F16E|nr:glycosyltransferase [Acinetobacter radioresistens]MCX0346043.1 glycosyltransferase [Acinetobacter radioresistens]
MKIVHIITGLNNGGAEGVLYRLVTNDKKNEHIVISMMDAGKYGPLLEVKNIKTYFLNLRRGSISISALINLKKILKIEQPDIVQTWMSHADLIGGIVARFTGFKNIVWNIRHSKIEHTTSNLKTRAIILLSMFLSNAVPKKIICCSYKTYEDYSNNGYRKDKMEVISNGYDFEQFNQNIELRALIRKELNIAENDILLGMVGRCDPAKNHLGLLEALSLVRKNINFKFLLIGRDLNINNELIVKKIKQLNLTENIILLDQRKDIPAIMNALDLHVLSSSYGEGFPNVIAEAMACGTLCVSTDVGDASVIVDQYGWVVQPNSPELLANAILKAIELKIDASVWSNMKHDAKKHIIKSFSLSSMIEKYNFVWKKTVEL